MVSTAIGTKREHNRVSSQGGPPALNPKRVGLLRAANAQVLGFTETAWGGAIAGAAKWKALTARGLRSCLRQSGRVRLLRSWINGLKLCQAFFRPYVSRWGSSPTYLT